MINTKKRREAQSPHPTPKPCPECGFSLSLSGGCWICNQCGFETNRKDGGNYGQSKESDRCKIQQA
jgi:ribosomal protein L37AE/L43A